MASPVTQSAVERYLADFEEFEREHSAPDWLRVQRRTAIEAFARLGFPTVRDEEWKYTDPTPAANLAVTPIFQAHLNGYASKIAAQLPFSALEGVRLVFVNGHFAPEVSRLEPLVADCEISSLDEAIANQSEVLPEFFGRTLDVQTDAFTALNTAFAQDGAFIRIGANVDLKAPIHLVFMTTGEAPTVTHPRNLITLGANARAKVVETYVGTGGVYFSNAVTEVVTAPGAQLEHVKAQLESESAFHVGTFQLLAARDVTASSHNLNFGGRLVRNNVSALMNGTNAEITFNGLVLARDEQHIDNHTTMDHAQPHCRSHELYAHVLDGASNGVFNGKIFVRLDAQKTDAKQSNRSLLLSRDAQVNAKPQLEILADDVKCTHGATIGQLEENALFYLRSRGVPQREARAILIRAFASEVLEGLSLEAVREETEREVARRLS